MRTFLVLLAALAAGPLVETSAEDGVSAGPALLKHWTFDKPKDESAPVADSVSGKPLAKSKFEKAWVPGVHGDAIRLDGPHKLRLAGDFLSEDIEAISFSAWITPEKCDGFREIFRQECARRILFSLQDNGTVLSLGLSVGGTYRECDARVDPAAVFNGTWRHCVGTFDGKTMRVYLDGKQIASLDNPGKLDVDQKTDCYIGSSEGTREHFSGAMDDLRIYRGAVSAQQVANLFSEGKTRVDKQYAEIQSRLNEVYKKRDTLVDTLAETIEAALKDAPNKEIAEKQADELARGLALRLSADFGAECEQFKAAVGVAPEDYFRSRVSSQTLKKELALRVEQTRDLLMEYCPITDAQWQALPPERRKHWRDAEKLAAELEAVFSGERSAPESRRLSLLISASSLIAERPRVREAVAPYRKPETPETRDLTAEEATAALRRDWLFQADGRPTKDRIISEIGWAKEMAERIETDHTGVSFAAEKEKLAELLKRAETVEEQDVEDLYLEVRRLKRKIMFVDPVVDFDKVLLVDMPYPAGNEWPHETRHRLGYMAVPGGRLLVLEGLSPAGHLRQLAPKKPLHGSFWRPDVSYDGRRVVFCFKPHNEKSFHLYEMNVDGSGLRQITDGIFDDLDPIYLPDGEHVVFSTTRGHTYVRCMPPTNAYVLARIKLSGEDLYLISRNNEPDYTPSVMNNGRLLYTRWEYTDKPLWRAQGLWTMNPNGTQVNTFWGNQTVWPDLLKDARSIPGSRRVMFTGSAHHNWFAGAVGIIAPDKGYNFPDGLTKVTADLPWPESGNGPVDPVESERYHASGKYTAYYSPYPLSEKVFLSSASRNGKFVLLLMDTDGNRELIYEGVNNIFHALPVRPRPRPALAPDTVKWPSWEDRFNPEPGVIYSSDVYQGSGIPRGMAKYLRVMNIEPKTYTYWNKRPYASTGPVVSMVQSEGVKKILGTVPIEEDGSVSFNAPSGMALHFQLLDENYRCLQTMRSFTGVMPGESRGCLGCHELQTATPGQQNRTAGIATRKPPREITPPPWEDRSVSYYRYVQPVLDKYCGECHQGDGKGRKKFDMTLRENGIFPEPYVTLIGRPSWGRPYVRPKDPPPGFGIAGMLYVEGYHTTDPAAYKTPPPLTALSYKSKLIEIASSGKHNKVKVDPVSLRRLIVWVDAMCPLRGSEEVRAIADPEFQGSDWLSIRPRIESAPRVVRPGPLRSGAGHDAMYDRPDN